jgi:hypothetical protein
MDPATEEARQRCLEMIALIQRDYQRQIQPYLDILAMIEACRPPPPVFLDVETARLRGFL